MTDSKQVQDLRASELLRQIIGDQREGKCALRMLDRGLAEGFDGYRVDRLPDSFSLVTIPGTKGFGEVMPNVVSLTCAARDMADPAMRQISATRPP